MRIRATALCAVLIVLTLASAGCSSGGSNAPAVTTGRAPTGTVTVTSGGKVICVMKIKDGKGTCTMHTNGYAPGAVNLNASYSGDSTYGKAQGSTSLKLNKAP
jgi:hypothetical protein